MSQIHVFCMKNFQKKMSLKNPKTLIKCLKKSPASNADLQFLKSPDFFLELLKNYKTE